MDTVAELITAIGRPRFTEAIGRGPQVVSRAIRENILPAAWFPIVRDLCAEAGRPVPERLFRWEHGNMGKVSERAVQTGTE